MDKQLVIYLIKNYTDHISEVSPPHFEYDDDLTPERNLTGFVVSVVDKAISYGEDRMDQ